MNRLIPSLAARRPAMAIFATVLALAGVAAVAGASVAMAQTTAVSAADLAGKTVRDSDGKALGVVERAITTADGRVKQVLVRTKKGPSNIVRSLPYSSLTAQGDALVSVLSQAEFEAIPASPVS